MIVMLSALGEQPVLRPMITPPCRSREPCDAALLSLAMPPAEPCDAACAGLLALLRTARHADRAGSSRHFTCGQRCAPCGRSDRTNFFSSHTRWTALPLV